MIDWPLFALFLATAFAAGSMGAFFTPGLWYERLDKPGWTPPNWLFPIAWFALFVSMSYAAMRVAVADAPGVVVALGVWGLQITLNAVWSPVFFGLRRLGPALLMLSLLWLAVVAMGLAFWRVDPVAGYLIVPYVVWTSYAFALNLSLWRRNPFAAEIPGD